MSRFTRLLSLVSFLLSAGSLANAQKGDRRGEEQKPFPAHIKVPPAPVLSPEEERATFTLAPGFHAELIAADPLIGDPVALQFGADGRLWVLEMRGYMPNIDGEGERDPNGVIAVLEDTDGDGRFDRRHEFMSGLVLPRAFALVGDGVLVGEPTNLWYVRDTDGDGKADQKTNVATDYGNNSNPEHNANGLMWALDNWIYSAKWNGRFRWLGEGRFARETTIPRGQWGLSQDDTGRIFYNTNSDPLRYDAVPSAYLTRHPFFTASGTNVAIPGVPGSLRIWPGRMTPGVNRGYRGLDEHFKLRSMTAACGPVVYRGGLFPEEFRGHAFVAEPSANLIKRIKLEEKDGALRGGNAYEGTEFMTSTDERFRPVNLFNGPDGALYVVDFYRGVIQHRTFVTTFLRKQIEERKLQEGIHLGRIWRIVPDGAPKANYQPGLGGASSAELAVKLGDAHGWVRDTAQRLLVERRDPAAKSVLARLALDGSQPALARLHALWTLEGSDALERETVMAAFRDRDSRVAAAAVRISEKFFAPPGGTAELLARLAALVPARFEPDVRLQLAFTLGVARTPGADEALRGLVVAAGRQPFLADAVVSGLAGRELEFIEALAKNPQAAARGGDVLRYATSAILKAGESSRIDRVLARAAAGGTPEWARSALLAGVRHFLSRSPDGRVLPGKLPAEPKPLLALAANRNAAASSVAQQLINQLNWPGKPGSATAGSTPLSAAEQVAFEQGKAKFAALCAACHQPNGQGLAGLAPSLIYSRWVLGDPRLLARIVLNGKIQENLVMPPWKAALDDEAIGGVLTFIRRSWGHDAAPVAAATVTEARADTAAHEEPFSDADLEELAQSLGPPRK